MGLLVHPLGFYKATLLQLDHWGAEEQQKFLSMADLVRDPKVPLGGVECHQDFKKEGKHKELAAARKPHLVFAVCYC